jgi:hypothetical protein
VSLGFEAGLSVVILAIFLDRITAALGTGNTPFGRLRAARKHRGTPVQPEPAQPASGGEVSAEAASRPGALMPS